MTDHSPAVAIIGAGIAGLALARRLSAAGIACALFDKGRRPGGRMATREGACGAFDHGAQFFTVRGADFRALVAEWRAAGAAAAWFDESIVGVPAMRTPLDALAAGFDLTPACEITSIARGSEGWRLAGSNGPLAHPRNGRFVALVLAIPAPQAVRLAAGAGLRLVEAEAVVYAPCWALMQRFDGALGIGLERFRDPLPELAWIARDGAKPGRAGGETWVVHAAPSWSRGNLERSPEAVAPELAALAARALGHAATPVHQTAHRWRYALVERTAGAPCLFEPATGLGACGDWCLGPRVEAAFDSGHALAGRLIETLGGAHHAA